MWFRFRLAEHLRCTVAELGERMTAAEYVAWKGYFRAKRQLEAGSV